MTHSDFVHLHVHTQYSLLDGACRIPDLVQKAAELRMPALAMTDHGNVFGAIDFYRECMKQGVKPIIGCEAYISPGSRLEKSVQGAKETAHHIILLAKDEEGYRNLMELVSIGYLEGFYYKPRIDKETLAKFGKGLLALSSCLRGVLNVHLAAEQFAKAKEEADAFSQILGKDNFYVEIQNHGLPKQKEVLPHLLSLAVDMGLPVVATNDVHYLERAHAKAHDALMAIQTQTTIDDEHRMRYDSEEFYLKSAEEMKEVFKEFPQAIKNSLEIAEKCNLELDFKQIHLPNYDVPPGKTQEDYLLDLCEQGLQQRYGEVTPALQQRLDHELTVIRNAGYTSYFLIVWDFVQFAKQHGIPVGPGRGSAAGSIVSYTLGITDVDPVRYNLLFERFLNPQRVSMPDIDIDFCYERRNEVIEYVIQKYGKGNVAQIITFGTMQARAVVRDVGRVMKMAYGDVDRLAKLIPAELDITLERALAQVPELAQMVKTNPQIRQLFEFSQVLEGLTRHASTHAAGVAIADKPLTSYMPLFKASEGQISTGYSMDALEKIGVLKIDMLGLRTLTVIAEAAKIIKRTRQVDVDLENLPLDDPGTFALLTHAETFGVFQLESGGMRDLLKKLQPTQFEDIVALLALYRPGPIGSGMLDDFIKRKHGEVVVKYDHPKLEPILKNTYGVCLSGDTTIEDVRTGVRYCLEELPERPDLVVQAVDAENRQVAAPVLRVIDNGMRPVYRVKLRNGFEIKMTADHRVLTETGWKPLQELAAGTHIAIPRSLVVQSGEYDMRRLRILAYLIADGDLSNKSGVNFISTDPELLADFEECLEGFELVQTARLTQIRGVTRLVVTRPRRADVAYHTPSGLLAFLREHGLKDQRGGLRSWEKFVPPFVFALTPVHLAVFVAALWDCDGFVGPKMCHYVTTSPRLANDVQVLLLKLGMASTVYTSRYQTTRHGWRTKYQVSVYDGPTFTAVVQPHLKSRKRLVRCAVNSETTISREIFFDELRSVVGKESQRGIQRRFGIDRQHFSPRGRRRPRLEGQIVREVAEQLELMGSLRLLRLRWEPIEEIAKVGLEHVYDLEVADVHNFVANGIIVHNCVYQEQVMRIASDLGGFSLAQADLLRRSMGKKDAEIMEKARQSFVDGCVKHGVVKPTAEKIFRFVEHFAGYGFNRSHSAAYAMISYRTAYLKAHYPIEFMTALLTSEMGNTDKVVTYIEETKRMGIAVQPPDINTGFAKFTVADVGAPAHRHAEGGADGPADAAAGTSASRGLPASAESRGQAGTISFGLAAVKNVGQSAIDAIVEARKAGGPFASLHDFCRRVDLHAVNRKVVESLIKCGAFDGFKLFRAQLTAMVDRAFDEGGALQKDRSRGQLLLFDGAAGGNGGNGHGVAEEVPHVREWPENQLLNYEKELLGFYITGHPLARYSQLLESFAVPTTSLKSRGDNETVTVGGLLTKVKHTTTKKTNERMAVALLEDLHGDVEVLIFPASYPGVVQHLKVNTIVFIEGRVSQRDEEPKLITQTIIPLPEAALRLTKAVEVHVRTPGLEEPMLASMKLVLERYPGATPVFLTMSTPKQGPVRMLVDKRLFVEPRETLLSELEEVLGSGTVRFRR